MPTADEEMEQWERMLRDRLTSVQTRKTKIKMPDYIAPPEKLKGHAKAADPTGWIPGGSGDASGSDDTIEPTADMRDDGTLIDTAPAAEVVPPVATKPKKKFRRPRSDDLPPVKTDNRLALVPDSELFDSYVGREFHGMSYVHVFDYARKSKSNVLISGPTGSGKTHATMAYAALRGLPFYSVSSSVGIEPTQLFGKFIPDDAAGAGFVWQDGPVTDLIRHGGVLLLNEVNFIPERISTVLFSVLDSRREIQLVDHKGEVITGHPNLLIVADMNPAYEGTRPLNRAFRNRFSIQLDWDYDSNVEETLITNKALRHLANKIRQDSSAHSVSTPCSTNMLLEFDKFVRATGNVRFATMNFLAHFDDRDRSVIDVIIRQMVANIEEDYSKENVIIHESSRGNA